MTCFGRACRSACLLGAGIEPRLDAHSICPNQRSMVMWLWAFAPPSCFNVPTLWEHSTCSLIVHWENSLMYTIVLRICFFCIISLLAGPSAGVVSTNVTSSCVHQGPSVCVITVALPHLFIWKHMNHFEELNMSKWRFCTFLLSRRVYSVVSLKWVGCNGNGSNRVFFFFF